MSQQLGLPHFINLINNFLDLNAGNPTKQQIQEASHQLSHFSQQDNFISIALEYISSSTQKHGLTLATSLLKDKFKYQFETMTRQQLQNYYGELVKLTHILGVNIILKQSGSLTIMSNLSLAIAYIILNITAISPQPIQTFLWPFLPNQQSAAAPLNYFFKILQFLAAEIDSSKIVIDQQLRMKARQQLIQQQKQILLQLNTNAPIAWENRQINRTNLIQCFTQWVLIKQDHEVLNSLPDHFLMQKVFESTDQVQEEVLYCLRKIISILGSPQQYGKIYAYLGTKMMTLLGVVDSFLTQMRTQQAADVLRIVIRFAEKAVPIFLQHPDEQVKMFLNKFVSIMKEDLVQCFQELADFWEFLIDQAKGVYPTALAQQLAGCYEAYCINCKYNLRLIKQLNSRSEHRIGDFSRQGQIIYKRRQFLVSFTPKYAALRGIDDTLQFVIGKIQEIAQQEESKLWPYLEVYLWSLVDVVQNAQYSQSVQFILAIYLELLNKQNFSIPIIVKKTYLRIFRGLLSVKGRSSQFVQQTFKLTVDCFQNPMLTQIAMKTFQKGCEVNSDLMRNHLPQIVPFVQRYPNRQQVIRGVMFLICQKEDLVRQYLLQILGFVYSSMTAAEQKDASFSKQYMYCLVGAIKLLSEKPSIHPQCKNPVLQFTRAIWPYLLSVLANPPNLQNDQSPQVQRVAKLIKVIMRFLKFDFTQFVQSLFSTVLAAFQKYPVCSYVYILQIAITVFYQDARFTQYFKGIYVKFCQTMSPYLASITKMQNYCYLIDDFIGMNKRFLIYNASIILSSGQLPYLIDLCISLCFGCEIPRIAKSAYAFFEIMFMVYWRPQYIQTYNSKPDVEKITINHNNPLYQQLRSFLVQKLSIIVGKIVQHLNQSPAQMTRNYIQDTLEAQIKAFHEQNFTVWSKVLAQMPSDILLTPQKQRFMFNLNRMKQEQGSIDKEVLEFFNNYLQLISRRMVNAKRRKLDQQHL